MMNFHRYLRHLLLKVVDSRPAQSAGQVKKNASNPLKVLVCVTKASIFSFEVSKVQPVLLTDELQKTRIPVTQILRKYG